jgi:alcohol dehydrogenase class IV
MTFEFAAPTRVIFGDAALQQAGKITSDLGKRVVVVHGAGGAAPEKLLEQLDDQQLEWQQIEVTTEPSIASVSDGAAIARSFAADVIIGYGGGSALDTAKAISAVITNPGELLDYLEVIGRGLSLRYPAAPCIAIPTTAGTGSEVTRNAVLSVPEEGMKVSMRSPLMLPRVALVDPEVTYSLPPQVTATTGMDAITQVLEPYVSIRSNAMTDLFCREGLQNGPQALLQAYHNGNDRVARGKMAWTSLMGGLALANAGLGAVHGFASPFGGMFDAPHGAVCARLLAPVMAVNVRALQERQPGSPALERYAEVSRWVTGNDSAQVEDGIQWLEQLTSDLAIPHLSQYGLNENDIPAVVEKAAVSSSMKANPIKLTDEELVEILFKAIR